MTGNVVGMRVLVIDDDALLREVATAILVAEGHEVVTAPSGEEGLRMAGIGGFDVVVCDFQMPGGIGGLEVRSRLPEGLRRRFVLWTGAPELVEEEGVRVVTKPSSVEALTAAVTEASLC